MSTQKVSKHEFGEVLRDMDEFTHDERKKVEGLFSGHFGDDGHASTKEVHGTIEWMKNNQSSHRISSAKLEQFKGKLEEKLKSGSGSGSFF